MFEEFPKYQLRLSKHFDYFFKQKIMETDSVAEEHGIMESRIRCDKSVEGVEVLSEEFNFGKFTSYLQFNKRLERLDRLTKIKAGTQVTDLTYYTDEILALELENHYGQLDKESEKYKKIFKNYKTERLEEIADWICEEAQADCLDLKDIDEVDNENYFSVGFCDEELQTFECIHNIFNTGVERFVLPRPQLQNSHLYSFHKNCVEVNLINLARHDPQIQLPSNIVPDRMNQRNNGEHLAAILQEIVDQHPFGVCPRTLNLLYQNREKCIPDYKSLGYKTFTDYIVRQNHIAWPQTYEEGVILFPTYLQGYISSPRTIFWSIFHQLKVILSLSHGIIKVSEAIALYRKLSQVKLSDTNVKFWGFSSVDQFVRFLFTYWSHSQIRCLSEHEFMTANKSSTNAEYLVNLNDGCKKLIKKHQAKQCHTKVQANNGPSGTTRVPPKLRMLPSHSTIPSCNSREKQRISISSSTMEAAKTWAKVAQTQPVGNAKLQLKTCEEFPPL